MVIWRFFETGDNVQALKSFVEKPDRATAGFLILLKGVIIGTSDMFCFAAGVMAENMTSTCE